MVVSGGIEDREVELSWPYGGVIEKRCKGE